jgi:hypothetical protein
VLEFVGGIFIADNHAFGMRLQNTDCPDVVNGFLDGMAHGSGFAVSAHHYHHFTGRHNGLYSYGQGCFGNQIKVVPEKARIGDDGISGQGFDSGFGSQRRKGFVKG